MKRLAILTTVLIAILFPSVAHAAEPCWKAGQIRVTITSTGELSAKGNGTAGVDGVVSLRSQILRRGTVEYINDVDYGVVAGQRVGYDITERLPLSFVGQRLVVRVTLYAPCGVVRRAVAVTYRGPE